MRRVTGPVPRTLAARPTAAQRESRGTILFRCQGARCSEREARACGGVRLGFALRGSGSPVRGRWWVWHQCARRVSASFCP
jgi:hypothetical protein